MAAVVGVGRWEGWWALDYQAANRAQAGSLSTAKPAWRAAVVASLAKVTEWLFLFTLVILPLDVYLTLPGAQSGVFLSQALTIEATAMLVITLLVGKALGEATRLNLSWKDLLPLGFVLAAASLSVIFATSRSVAAKEWFKVLGFLCIYLLARAIRDMKGVRRLALMLMLGGFVIVLISGLLGYTSGLPDIPGVLLNIQRNSAAIPYSTVLRAEATFRYPNELAAYLLILLPLLLACVISAREFFERSSGFVVLMLGIYLLVLTYTRSALAAFAITVPILLYVVAGRRLALIGCVVIAVGAALLVIKGGVASSRIFSLLSLQTAGYSGRVAAWQWAWDAFIHHPLFGVGIGNLPLQPNAPVVSAALNLREIDAENLLLNVLAEMGIVGLAAVLYCFIGALRLVWHARQASAAWVDRAWNNGLFAVLCGLLLFGLADPVLVSGQITGILCAVVGLAGAVPVSESLTPPPQPTLEEKLSALKGKMVAMQGAPALQSRIVFLLNSPHLDSVQQHALNLATALWHRATPVLVVVPQHSPLLSALESRGVPCVDVDLGRRIGHRQDLFEIFSFLGRTSQQRSLHQLRLLAQSGPTMFVCPYLREQLLVTSRIGRQDNHVVWLLHSTPVFWLPRLFLRRLWVKRSGEVDAAVVFSQRLAHEATNLGLSAERLAVIPIAEHATPQDETASVYRSPDVILTCAPLDKYKGIQYLIGALPRVIQRRPRARLIIVGSGPDESALRDQVRDLGLESRVEFVGDTHASLRLLQQVSLFVYPTVDPAEVLPDIIIDALAIGTPVVASAIGSIPDVVVDRRTGALSLPGDEPSLAKAIITLLEDPASAQAMARAGREMMRFTRVSNTYAESFLHMMIQLDVSSQRETIRPTRRDATLEEEPRNV